MGDTLPRRIEHGNLAMCRLRDVPTAPQQAGKDPSLMPMCLTILIEAIYYQWKAGLAVMSRIYVGTELRAASAAPARQASHEVADEVVKTGFELALHVRLKHVCRVRKDADVHCMEPVHCGAAPESETSLGQTQRARGPGANAHCA